MIISVNWLKKYTDIDVPIDELATLIGARLVEIEEVVDLGAKYKDVVVVKVVECAKLEGSDHLSVTKIDDGGARKDVERDENGLVQVVCGAPNIAAGQTVAWLPPNSIVPETFDDAEPFVLGSRKLMGVMSNGMIASAKELDLYEDHTGILVLADDLKPGSSFAEAYELDDYLLDIENKSLTHRPDTFGIIGFAREVAAIQGKQFHTPEWLALARADFGSKDGDVTAPTVTIDNPELSARYQAVVIANANGAAQSPLHIQTYLARAGVRPISAVVDVTNYLMLLTGQPLHAFDYDKLLQVGGGTADIHVRAGREGETLELLDGRTVELAPEDIVIAAGETAIGLAGAMGGANTEIDGDTKNIIIESATFNLYNLRGTQMRHGIFSEAITRFTKGQSAGQTEPVLAEAVRLIGEYAGGVRASDVAEARPSQPDTQPIVLTVETINGVLGTTLTAEQAAATLQHVEFRVEVADAQLSVTPPYWRADIHIAEDVVEEIGRLGGYDEIMPTLPTRDFTAVQPAEFDQLRTTIRRALLRAGANEVLTYSFVHGDVLTSVGQDPADSYRITNSLSPDLQYYRQSLTPSLLGLVHPNSKQGYDDFALFELNKVHSKTAKLVEDGTVPAELHRVGLVVAHKKQQPGAPYYQAKALLEYLAESLGLSLAYKTFPADTTLAFTKPFDLRRSARVVDTASGQSIGIVGEYKSTVARNFKLPANVAGFELLTEAIELALAHKGTNYAPLSRYPSTDRDMCFRVTADVAYADVVATAEAALAEATIETTITPVDIYHEDGSDTKNITIRITLLPRERTLTADEANDIVQQAADHVVATLGAVVV